MHTVFALLCFVVVIHWLIFPYPSGLLHWHCGNLTIAPVPAKQPWWIWINTSYEFIMNDCITTTKQSTTKPCAYFLGYTVAHHNSLVHNSVLNPYLHHFRITQITWFMGPTWGLPGAEGPRWAPCWPHEPCYLGTSLASWQSYKASEATLKNMGKYITLIKLERMM